MKEINIIGQKFGRLTVLSFSHSKNIINITYANVLVEIQNNFKRKPTQWKDLKLWMLSKRTSK